MMPNKAAKNIWIKRLSKKDRTMLEALRAMLNTSYNSEAILKAGYLCLQQQIILKEKDGLILKAHQQKELVEEKLMKLQDQLSTLFKLDGDYKKHYEAMKQGSLKAARSKSKEE